MKQVDLDSITSKTIRNSLEQELAQNLNQYKAFIDEEILVILGYLYLYYQNKNDNIQKSEGQEIRC